MCLSPVDRTAIVIIQGAFIAAVDRGLRVIFRAIFDAVGRKVNPQFFSGPINPLGL
jgi:hypothetical protein